MCPHEMSNASGAGSRSTVSVISSSSTSSPAAICRTTEPQAIDSTPGISSIGLSSSGLPKPMMSKTTSRWL